MADQVKNNTDFAGIPQYLCIEDNQILKDCASVSHIVSGSFIKSTFASCQKLILDQPGQIQAILLRSNDTLEMYKIQKSQFHFVTKYEINGKCTEMVSLRLTWKEQDVIIFMIPQNKFLMLEFDEEVSEFKIFSMHNFNNNPQLVDSLNRFPMSGKFRSMPEVEETGKKFPFSGKLRSISSYFLTCFGYIADDHKFVWVELRQAVLPDLSKAHSSHTTVNIIETSVQKRLNEHYLNAWGKDIENYIKPAQFRNLKQLCGITKIIDIELIEMNQKEVYLYVLHQSDIEKIVGISQRQNISKLSIIQMVQPNNDNSELVYLYTIDYLSYYVRNIIKAQPTDDFVYILGAFSIYIIRQETKRFAVIQTSGLATIIEQDKPRNQEKLVLASDQYSIKNIIDLKQLELRFDGCTRAIALPGRKMLIITEKGIAYMMQVQFDQADLDVADAHFNLIKSDSTIIPSQVILSLQKVQITLNETMQQDQYEILVSSYFNDTSLFILKQVQEDMNLDLEKRQKTEEMLQIKTRVKYDQKYELLLSDSLTTISPITDVLQLENSQGELELLTVSGYHNRSYLTFIKVNYCIKLNITIQSSLPYGVIFKTSLSGSNIKRIFTVRDEKKKDSNDCIIMLATDDSTRILNSTTGLNEIMPDTNIDFIFNETTISCQSVGVISPQKIIQVTPTCLSLLTLEGKLINKYLNIEQAKIIFVCKYLGGSDLLFVLLNTNQVQVFQASTLQINTQIDCSILTQPKLNITAMSSSYFNEGNEYLVIAYKEKGMIRIYQVDELNSILSLIFEVKHVSQQYPFLANQLFGKQDKYIFRSPTDLSTILDIEIQSQEIVLDKQFVTELQLIQLQGQKVLVVVFSNGQLLVYQSLPYINDIQKEKFRFKLLQSQNLKIRKTQDISINEYLNGNPLQQNITQQANNQVVILLPQSQNILTLTEQKGKLLVHQVKIDQKEEIQTYSKLTHKVFGIGGTFIYFDVKSYSLKVARFWPIFDVSIASKFTDTYAIKQIVFDGRCVKKAAIHRSSSNDQQYIVLATFQQVKGENITEYGLKLNDSQRGHSVQYTIEVYQLPLSDSSQGNQKNLQKQYTVYFEPNQVIKTPMRIDEVVINVENVRLKIQDGSFKNFIGVSSMKIDSAMVEEGFYSSFLNIYEIEHQERRLKLAYVENSKGPITCLTHYQGYLVAMQRSQRLKDMAVIFFKFNDQQAQLKPFAQPQSIKTLGTSISFDGDHIFVGDIKKNISVLWLCDKEELKKEKIEDIEGIIKLKHLFSNTMDASVIGVYSMRIQPIVEPLSNHFQLLNDVDRQQLTLLTACEDGYIRLFQLRETKSLECTAQINIQDSINKIVPLGLDTKKPISDQRRRFIVLPKRGGITIVTTVNEQEYYCMDSLVENFTRFLPHRGGIAPIFAHKKPQVPSNEKNSTLERMNRYAVDKRTISSYYFMSAHLQRIFSDKVGFNQDTINDYFTN